MNTASILARLQSIIVDMRMDYHGALSTRERDYMGRYLGQLTHLYDRIDKAYREDQELMGEELDGVSELSDLDI